MKKKFDLKLTACLVSLFISFALIIFFNHVPAVVSIGLMIIAAALFFLAKIRAKKIDETLKSTQEDIDNAFEDGDYDEETITEVYKEMNSLRKQKRSLFIAFNGCAVLLFVVAIFMLL